MAVIFGVSGRPRCQSTSVPLFGLKNGNTKGVCGFALLYAFCRVNATIAVVFDVVFLAKRRLKHLHFGKFVCAGHKASTQSSLVGLKNGNAKGVCGL